MGIDMHSVIGWFVGLWAFIAEWFPWKQRTKAKESGPQTKTYYVNDYHFPGNPASPDRRNKARADQSQKAKHNRRRKPRKNMRRLYQLGRNKAHPLARRS
jgi:hypothetical protein